MAKDRSEFEIVIEDIYELTRWEKDSRYIRYSNQISRYGSLIIHKDNQVIFLGEDQNGIPNCIYSYKVDDKSLNVLYRCNEIIQGCYYNKETAQIYIAFFYGKQIKVMKFDIETSCVEQYLKIANDNIYSDVYNEDFKLFVNNQNTILFCGRYLILCNSEYEIKTIELGFWHNVAEIIVYQDKCISKHNERFLVYFLSNHEIIEYHFGLKEIHNVNSCFSKDNKVYICSDHEEGIFSLAYSDTLSEKDSVRDYKNGLDMKYIKPELLKRGHFSNIKLLGDYLYFINIDDNYSIYKMKTDGANYKKVTV